MEVTREIKEKVWNYTKAAITDFSLVRPDNCSKCNAICKPDAHHPDYNDARNIIWLCKDCHRKVHIAERKTKIKTHIKKPIINIMEKMMTVAELAKMLNWSKKTVYYHIDKGGLPHYKIMGSIRFKPHEIEKWIKEQQGIEK